MSIVRRSSLALYLLLATFLLIMSLAALMLTQLITSVEDDGLLKFFVLMFGVVSYAVAYLVGMSAYLDLHRFTLYQRRTVLYYPIRRILEIWYARPTNRERVHIVVCYLAILASLYTLIH